MRHQQLQCYYNLDKHSIDRDIDIGPGDSVSTSVLAELGLTVSLSCTPYRSVMSI